MRHTESLEMLDVVSVLRAKQEVRIVKWVAEGMLKGILCLVAHDVSAYVSCAGCDSTRRGHKCFSLMNQGGTAV